MTDPVLRELARPLRTDELDGSALDAVVARMWRVLDTVGGVGLAAPQVGVPLAVFLVRYGEVRAAYANPVRSGLPWPSTEFGREGCLSLPGYGADVMRPRTVMLEAFRIDGPRKGRGPTTVAAADWLARVYCHEADHLEGRLYIDRAIPGTFRLDDLDRAGSIEAALRVR
jgi:peptide deformylase